MFRQRAHGSFTVSVVQGTPHCGVNDEQCSCHYRVELVYADDALDGNGFLLDNTAFRDYFASFVTRPVSVSCETLCKIICADLCKLCDNRARRVTVALSPFDGVEVAYIYRPVTGRESTAHILAEFGLGDGFSKGMAA